MKIIDLEAHFWTEEYIEYLRARKQPPRLEKIEVEGCKEEALFLGPGLRASRKETFKPLVDLQKSRLSEMDSAGITVQVLTLSSPGCEMFEPSDGRMLARKTNDKLAEVVARNPDRFVGLAALAPQDPDGAAKELERAVKELGFKGANINSHVLGGEYLDHKKYWIIFGKAEELGVPIYLHPSVPSTSMVKPYAAYGYGLAGAALGFAAETSLHVMRLIFSGVFDRYPGLKIILGHLGESLPFWLQRIDCPWRTQGGKVAIARKPSDYIRQNFALTFSGMFFMPAFLCVYLALGAESIMFATDYPFEKNKEATDFIHSLPICDADKHKISHSNAESLLKL